jgi:REP element-mobilizing transposase RayT
VVVRGHNRDPILARHDDFRFLYKCLLDAVRKNSLAVHAWVFMHNHLHILATPPDADALPRTMQSLGRRYAQYFNRTYHRSGSLWEGRYKASPVDTDRYLLACYRYIELNPVRAGIARRPEDYPYSSYHANALGKGDALLTPHEIYLALVEVGGRSRNSEECDASIVVPPHDDSNEVHSNATPTPQLTPQLDRRHYQTLFDTALTQAQLTTIRRGTDRELGIGQADFLLKVASLFRS